MKQEIRSEYIAIHDGKKLKYISGKYEFVRPNGTSEIFYLKSSQIKLLEKIYERIGFNKIFLLKEIHESDIPRWERI